MSIDNIITETTDVDALAAQRVAERDASVQTQAQSAATMGANYAASVPRPGVITMSRDDLTLVTNMGILVMLVLIWRRL